MQSQTNACDAINAIVDLASDYSAITFCGLHIPLARECGLSPRAAACDTHVGRYLIKTQYLYITTALRGGHTMP